MKFSLAALAASLVLAGCASGPLAFGGARPTASASRTDTAGSASSLGVSTSGTMAGGAMTRSSQSDSDSAQRRQELYDRMTIEREVERSPGP